MRLHLLMFFSALLFSTLAVGQNEQQKIVHCDIDQILLNHPSRTKLEEAVRIEARAFNDTLDLKKVALKQKLSGTAVSTLSDEAKQSFYKEVQTAQAEIKRLEKEYTLKVTQKKNALFNLLLEEVTKSIEALAQEEDYAYIINTGQIGQGYLGGEDITLIVARRMGITLSQ